MSTLTQIQKAKTAVYTALQKTDGNVSLVYQRYALYDPDYEQKPNPTEVEQKAFLKSVKIRNISAETIANSNGLYKEGDYEIIFSGEDVTETTFKMTTTKDSVYSYSPTRIKKGSDYLTILGKYPQYGFGGVMGWRIIAGVRA